MVLISILSLYLSSEKLHRVHPSSLFLGGWALYQIFKRERLDRISVLRSQDLRGWLLGKIGVTFFREGCSFYVKNKLKSEIFNDEKERVAKKKGWWCFWGEWRGWFPMHTMNLAITLTVILIFWCQGPRC